MTRVLITGSRHWHCTELAERIVQRLLNRYGPELVIVHGAAPGVDTAFAEACRKLGVEAEAHPATWETAGRAAGPQRNQRMVDAGADLAIACHPNILESKGTRDCVCRCVDAGIPVWLIESDEGRPKQIELQ